MKKTILTTLFLLITTISFSQKKTTNLKCEITFDSYLLTTFLKVNQTENHYIMTSPKNGDVRTFGYKARLGRLLGKSPKKGILATIDCVKKGDSLIGNIDIAMIGKMKFKGSYKNEILKGKIINDTLLLGTIKGVKSEEQRLDYKELYTQIEKITNKNIYSKSILQTKEWKRYQRKLKKRINKVHDDIELFFGFTMLKSKLPISHYDLLILNEKPTLENDSINDVKTVFYKKETENTSYLKIKNFETSKDEILKVFPKVLADNPKNLIIDLRDNYGGGIEAAFAFGKYIMSTTEVGYFTTNRLQNVGFDADLLKKLPIAEPQTTDEFIANLKQGKGAKLVFRKTNSPMYLGNLYILTNENTASTCEPIVYALKKSKRAIIIGENTAGAMFSAALFDIYDKYKLYLPIADFYTYDGMRLEGVGVKPDIETVSENALIKALEICK